MSNEVKQNKVVIKEDNKYDLILSDITEQQLLTLISAIHLVTPVGGGSETNNLRAKLMEAAENRVYDNTLYIDMMYNLQKVFYEELKATADEHEVTVEELVYGGN